MDPMIRRRLRQQVVIYPCIGVQDGVAIVDYENPTTVPCMIHSKEGMAITVDDVETAVKHCVYLDDLVPGLGREARVSLVTGYSTSIGSEVEILPITLVEVLPALKGEGIQSVVLYL